jgi:hypothetical protein
VITADCAIHVFRTRVRRCPICAAVIEEIRDRGDTRPLMRRSQTPSIIAKAKAARAARKQAA